MLMISDQAITYSIHHLDARCTHSKNIYLHESKFTIIIS